MRSGALRSLRRCTPEVADIRVDERTGRLRQEHLPAVPDGCDPRALVHVEADVSLLGQPRLAGVQPHPHA